jgi:DNA helicase HerA-like ATPase
MCNMWAIMQPSSPLNMAMFRLCQRGRYSKRTFKSWSNRAATKFFGEPALDIHDWLVQDDKGRGMISILHCVELFQNPLLYSSFLLWMLSQLYDLMPEVGDLEKPKMVFFFDEAHLILMMRLRV